MSHLTAEGILAPIGARQHVDTSLEGFFLYVEATGIRINHFGQLTLVLQLRLLVVHQVGKALAQDFPSVFLLHLIKTLVYHQLVFCAQRFVQTQIQLAIGFPLQRLLLGSL